MTTNRRVFVYDDNAHLLGEYDASTGQYQEHLWLGDTPIANLRQPLVVGGAVQTYYVLADHLDTPKQLIDPTLDVATTKGRVLWRWEGEAFGNSPADEDADNNGTKLTYNLRFPGQYADVETNRFYNYYRDYDPALGRYIESDPIGLKGGINTYGYVKGNPVSWSDPLGLMGNCGTKGGPCNPPRPVLPKPKTQCNINDIEIPPLDENGCVPLGDSGVSFCPSPAAIERIASEKVAVDIAKQIERDLGKDARRKFHDLDHLVDRTLSELKADAKEIYDAAGKAIPKWLRK